MKTIGSFYTIKNKDKTISLWFDNGEPHEVLRADIYIEGLALRFFSRGVEVLNHLEAFRAGSPGQTFKPAKKKKTAPARMRGRQASFLGEGGRHD